MRFGPKIGPVARGGPRGGARGPARPEEGVGLFYDYQPVVVRLHFFSSNSERQHQPA